MQPFAGIAEAVLPGTPRIQFNWEASGPFAYGRRRNDVVMEGAINTQYDVMCNVSIFLMDHDISFLYEKLYLYKA